MEGLMSQILSTSDIVNLIETKCHTKVWNICSVGEMGLIEGTEFNEIMVMVYNKQDLNHIETILKDIVNVKEIIYTGFPKPASMTQI